MLGTRKRSFLRAASPRELSGGGQRLLFFGWNVLGMLASSALTCVFSQNFAIGVYDWGTFFGYFRHPLIFLLNWIPIFLLQLLLYCLVSRQWFAYLLSAVLILVPSVGNFFKIKFRDEPFTFRDMSSIRAGLSVAGSYDVSLNTRILAAIVCTLIGVLLMMFLVRGRMRRGGRRALALLALLSLAPLWLRVYSNDELYYRTAEQNLVLETWSGQEYFIANGFTYPFLHSITESRDLPPEGYDADEAAASLAAYADGVIPADRRVNVLVLQLESFTDFEKLGLSGITPETYSSLRILQDESLCGTLIANVIGGGTIDTERCFLTGSSALQNIYGAFPSFVRWFNDQGYVTTGSHPNRAFFYNRANVAEYLGFSEYLFLDNHFAEVTGGEWRCDGTYLPEVFRLFRERTHAGEQVFSFNVTLQGHGPYNTEGFDTEEICWPGEGCSERTRYAVNNYLSLIAETQRVLLRELDTLRSDPEPAVVLLYGDHDPWLEQEVYDELGIVFDLSTEQGMRDYYGTPYLIWANDTARAQLGDYFLGDGPTVSPGCLMGFLFEKLGWRGPAFMQMGDALRARMPVFNSNGYYLFDGAFTRSLPDEGKELLHQYDCAQFYLRQTVS